MAEPMVTFGGLAEVDMSDPRRIELAELAKRSPMPDGRHAWVLHVVHEIADPESALDSMVLDGDTMIGVTPIHCLFCRVDYEASLREGRCG